MDGPIKATWSGNDAWHTKVQTLRVTVYGTRKRWEKEMALTYADVQVVRKKRPGGFEWYGPEKLEVYFLAKAVASVTRVTVSVPEEMKQTYANLGVAKEEFDLSANLPMRPSALCEGITVIFPSPLCSFRWKE